LVIAKRFAGVQGIFNSLPALTHPVGWRTTMVRVILTGPLDIQKQKTRSESSEMSKQLEVDGLAITLERKRVKNVNLVIYPPDGRVRVSAPRQCTEETIRAVIRARWPWIMAKRAALQARPTVRPVSLVSGHDIALFGVDYLLEIVEERGQPSLNIAGNRLIMRVWQGATDEKRRLLLDRWYRQQLGTAIAELLDSWQPVIGVKVSEWRIRAMKTRWGTCNIREHRICLNLELARLPRECLEYVVVHELVHLLERNHNARFWGLVSAFYPDWRRIRTTLKQVSFVLADNR
jgi:predicted metal-dependent hydrolase